MPLIPCLTKNGDNLTHFIFLIPFLELIKRHQGTTPHILLSNLANFISVIPVSLAIKKHKKGIKETSHLTILDQKH